MMNKAEREEFDQLKRISEKDSNKISELNETIREQREELAHFRTALTAVKWLWDQATKQAERRPFQL